MKKVWQDIYKNNVRLDKIFMDKYLENEPEYFKKNAIEFLVELGEFANETKCFKYWTIKKPNRDDVLEEYADVITMALYFLGDLNADFDNIPKHIENDNILDVINYLYFEGSKMITSEYGEDIVKDLISNVFYVGELAGISEDEMIDAIQKKQAKVEDRLNSDY